MLTVLEVIKKTTEFFAARAIESPRLNAELIVGHALGLKRMQLYLQFERPLAEAELEKIRPLVRRRSQHEPVQYVLGETEFCGLRLKVDRRALIPRPETEQLVEHAIAARSEYPPSAVLDLGTGSGAIALALAQTFPAAAVTALDMSEEALALAAENAVAAGFGERIRFLRSNWFAEIPPDTRFDLIVANPPYLSAEETAAAPLEVRGFEPLRALTAGENGMGELRTIVANSPRYLAPNGTLVLETGIGHHGELKDAVAKAGYQRFESRRDLTGRDRFVLAYL
jgi:release factor glutamine methyltransferase